MKILSSFTHPQVVANLYNFFLLLNTKEDILKNDLNYGIVDFFCIFFSTMEVNGAKVPIILQNIFLCVQQNIEIIQVCNNLMVGLHVSHLCCCMALLK